MNLEDARADLQALRNLYCLLRDCGDSLQKSRNEILDERAKLLLKNLLDSATEKALESKSKIIAAAESDVSKTGNYSKAERFRAIPKLESRVSHGVIRSSKTDSNYSMFTSRKDELSLTKRTPEKLVLDLSKFGVASDRNKSCQFCEKSSMRQQTSAKKPGKVTMHWDNINDRVDRYVKQKEGTKSVKSNLSLRWKTINEFQRNPCVACSSSSLSSRVVKPIFGCNLFDQFDVKSDFSAEVANAIRRIDSAILALLDVDNCRNGLCKMANSGQYINARQKVSQRAYKDVNSTRPPNQLVSKTVEKMDLLNPAAEKPPLPSKMLRQKGVKRTVVKSLSSIMRPTLLEAESEMRTHIMDMDLESVETASSSSSTAQQTSSTYCHSDNEANSLPSKILVHRRFGSMGNESSSNLTGTCRSDHHANPDAEIGRLRRFKNKIGLIFHQHLHHHHHHHRNYKHYETDDSAHSKLHYPSKHMWKHLPNIFRHENRTEVYGKQESEKLRKSMTIIIPSKHGANYFHTIVGGLRRHIRNSKKSKLAKGRSSIKELHWWQMFKRNGGVKVGKKGRLRLGFRSKHHCL